MVLRLSVLCLLFAIRLGAGEASHPILAEDAKAIVTADGKRADVARLTDRPYVLVYFSAHWCPPCRAFTPDLVKFYQEKGGGTAFEVLFVSSDRDAAAMKGYMDEAKMPWVAMPWGASKIPAVKERWSGRGIPCLVLLDAQDQVLSHSYVDGTYVGPRQVLADLGKRLEAVKP